MPKPDTNGTGHKLHSRRSRLSPKTVAIRRRQAQAVQLRVEGMLLGDIAKRLGYRDRSAASKAIAASLRHTESASADELRHMHDQRLSDGYQAVYEVLGRTVPPPEVPDGADPAEVTKAAADYERRRNALAELQLKAIDRLTRLMEREARLHGLDAPARAEVNGQQVTVAFHSALQFPPPVSDADVVDAGFGE